MSIFKKMSTVPIYLEIEFIEFFGAMNTDKIMKESYDDLETGSVGFF